MARNFKLNRNANALLVDQSYYGGTVGLDIAKERAELDKINRKIEEKRARQQKKEQILKDFSESIDKNPLSNYKSQQTIKRPRIPVIDCGACKTSAAMSATKVPRFGGFIRFIGYLIVTPSVLGLAFSLLMFFSVGKVNSDLARRIAEPDVQAGVAIGSTLGVLGGLMLAGASLVGGLVGYLLLTKKKVFLCRVCGFILDRA